MSKSQETYSKKEREKKRQKRKREKAEKREQRKLDAKDGINEEPMFMYVDENGNLTPTPPDPAKKLKFKAEDIDVSTPKKGEESAMDVIRTGVVKFFNDEKGYGFIIDQETKESIFVHAAGLIDQIRDNVKVKYEVEMGPKGPNAVAVKLAG